MEKELKTRAFEICLEQLATGAELEEVLGLYPQWAHELRPALEAAQAVRWLAATIRIPEEAQRRSRERMVQAGLDRQRAQIHQKRPVPKHVSPALVSIFMLLVILFGLGMIVTSSTHSLPGEPLHPVKLAYENTRLWLERDAVERIKLEQSYDTERILEIQQLLTEKESNPLDRLVELSFSGALTKHALNEWRVGGIPVLIQPDTRLIGSVEEGYLVLVTGKLTDEGTVMVEAITPRYYEIQGYLEQKLENTWVVSRIMFRISNRTSFQGSAKVGDKVRVLLLQTQAGEYEAHLVQTISTQRGKQ